MVASGVVRHGTHTSPLSSTADACQVWPPSVDFDIRRREPAPGSPAAGGCVVVVVSGASVVVVAAPAGRHRGAGPGGGGSGGVGGEGVGGGGAGGGRSLVKA